MENVCEIVREIESNYTSGVSKLSKYVDFDMFETLNKIDAYVNSVHTSGSEDSLGRPKPFFNIVTAARNIWYRATDIDRKNIRLKTPKSSLMAETLAGNMLLKSWMRKSGFGQFLNDWGRTLATYCSAVSKFVEKDGELIATVIPWNRILCDTIDFNNNVVIEVLEFTPAQLRKQGYDEEVVAQLLEALSPREDLNKQKKDNKADYIKVYEVHGELPLSLITGKESDEEKYTQQMQVVSFVRGKYDRSKQSYNYDDYTLYKGREKKSPYQKDDLIKEDGRTLGIGSVESLFDAQWMVNHSQKQIKDTLDMASLLILQTSDSTMVGRNVLQSLVTGNILVHAENQPLTQLNNQHDITQIQSFAAGWQNMAKELTSTPDALRGNTQPSGTAYRLQQLITNQSESLFEVMRENKGLGIENMMRTFVLPFLKTKMDTSDEIGGVLESDGITQFDSMYVPNEAIRRGNKQIIDQILNPNFANPETPPATNPDLNALQGQVKNELSSLGNQRFIKPDEISDKTWKDALNNFEWDVIVDVTQEDEDTDAALTSLSSTFQTIASLAGRPMTPDERLIFNQIMEKAGMNPLQINQSNNQVPPSGGVSSPQVIQPMMAGKQ